MRVVNYLQIKDVDEYLKNKHYSKLIRLSEDKKYTYFIESNIAFWIKLSQALKIAADHYKMEDILQIIEEKMLCCDNYNSKEMREWHLLNAEYWLRSANPQLAIEQIEKSTKLDTQPELNCKFYHARRHLVEGIAYYHKGINRKAIAKLHDAILECNKHKCQQIEEYRSKIRLYWLKLFIKSGNDTYERNNLAREIIGGYEWGYKDKPKYFEGDKSAANRLRARLINLGPFGNDLDDALQKLFSSF